jgi:hypothetical protein
MDSGIVQPSHQDAALTALPVITTPDSVKSGRTGSH